MRELKAQKRFTCKNVECNDSEYQVFAVCFSFICVCVMCFTEICTDLTVLAGDCGMDIKSAMLMLIVVKLLGMLLKYLSYDDKLAACVCMTFSLTFFV